MAIRIAVIRRTIVLATSIIVACAHDDRPSRIVVHEGRCDASPTAKHRADSLIRIPAGDGVSLFEECWYSEQLHAMNEPRLSDAIVAPGDTVLRLTCLPTFSPGIAVRIERRGRQFHLWETELDGKGGYAPGKGVRREDRVLTELEWQTVARATNASDVWHRPVAQPDSVMTLDGTTWIFELKAAAQYHPVVRVRPDSMLLQLAAVLGGLSQAISVAECK